MVWLVPAVLINGRKTHVLDAYPVPHVHAHGMDVVRFALIVATPFLPFPRNYILHTDRFALPASQVTSYSSCNFIYVLVPSPTEQKCLGSISNLTLIITLLPLLKYVH